MSRRHEQLLFRYSSALERGEFETVADVLREAERDPALEQMILEMNEVYADERFSSSNHVNHTNPKEVPMTIALYQRRASSPVQWHSLPLVAALAIIAILTTLLAAQIRSNAMWNVGRGDTNPPALAQVGGICEATLRDATDARSRAGEGSVVVGTIPAKASVKVLDQQLTGDAQGGSWALWFFVVAEGADGVQGWIPAAALDASDCPQATIAQGALPTFTPTPANIVVTSQALPTFTVVPTNADAAVQALPTFTLIPANTTGQVATVSAAQLYMGTPCKATARTTADLLDNPSWEGKVLTSVARGAFVTVGNFAVSVDAQGRQDQWYYVEVEGKQGWILASLLDASECPPLASVASADVAPTFSIAPVQPANIQPGVVQPLTIEPSMFTTVPADAQTPSAMAFTIAPVTIAPDTHVITLPPTVVSGDTAYSYDFVGCTVQTEHVIDVFAEPSREGQVIEVVPSGTTFQIITHFITGSSPEAESWYYVMTPSGQVTSTSGYVMGNTLVLPASGCATPNFAVSAAPVDTPLMLQPTVAGTVSVQATPQYYIYVVQPGDTLSSILTRFGLGADVLPDVLRVNNLTEDSVIAPGITLYVPTSQQLISLACRISAAQALDLRVRPSEDAAVIGTLPRGATFELIDRSEQTDGVWYAISAQVEQVTVQGAWVRPGAITVPSDCQQSVPGTVITLNPLGQVPVPQPTPTIIP